MRSRTIREGSVGLLILLGLTLFAGLILWLRGLNPAQRSYRIVVGFANVAGMQIGSVVRYRGVGVGKITEIRPGPNGVEVSVDITPADLVIPRTVKVQVNSSGLLGETAIDIVPLKPLTAAVTANPLDRACDPNVILCNKSQLTGEVGLSPEEAFGAVIRFANTYTDPRFFENVNSVVKNGSQAAAEIAELGREFTSLAKDLRQEVKSVSTPIRTVATQASLTTTELNNLLTANRATLIATLNNLNQTSAQLRTTVGSFNTILSQAEQGEFLQNLETLSANVAQASANLRDLSAAVNSPENLTVLQQTLDSARVTFQNAEKITSDLDELTGDPRFRDNLRNLVNGLSGLVSSTQQLHQQTQISQILSPIAAEQRQIQAEQSHPETASQGRELAEQRNIAETGSRPNSLVNQPPTTLSNEPAVKEQQPSQ
ncbi:MlaD family protein [Pantanalinema sp. GBBB05]|uniref:MlaD family protein n=1 Tax=Pantanalinema sp. GBBB05 TaxID=2604139 RepID=UPI001D4AF63B|nr:MCE family protein [Pantanalinema sp. GBBB05]